MEDRLITVLVVCCILVAIFFLAYCYEDHKNSRLEKKNERLRRLLEEQFLMQNDSMNAYAEMMKEARRTSPRKTGTGSGEEEEE